MKKIIIISMIIGFMLHTGNCLSMAGQRLVIAGTGDSQALLRYLETVFEKTHPDIDIEIPYSIGSGGGILALINGKCDLARTARPLKDSEKNGLNQILFAHSPLVFATHPSVSNVSDLTKEQILGIYSGQYRNWKDIGGIDHKIYPIGRERGDSSYGLLSEKLPGFKDINYDVKIYYTTPKTASVIGDHEFTIGYIPMSMALENNLNILSVEGISPLSDSYPYKVPFYIVSKTGMTEPTKTFIRFLFSENSKKLMSEKGVIPVKHSPEFP